MPQSYSSLNYHVIYGTKHRSNIIHPQINKRLYAYIGGLLRSRNARLLAIGCVPDHIHLLITLPRDTSMSCAMRDVKSLSSGCIRRTFSGLDSFGWQNGYAAFSISYSDIGRARAYVEGQEERHQSRTFLEELIGQCEAHQIVFDEKYLPA